MSLTFNMVGGGGSGAAGLPAIYAKYPAGSVCTCSNGEKTFTAKDTSGFWLFAGLSVGNWIVTATDGTYTASKAMSITSEGQSVNVELIYKTWLFQSGEEFTDLTGGWSSFAFLDSSYSMGSFTKYKDEYLYLETPSGNYQVAVATNNKIDVSNINTLTAKIGHYTFAGVGFCNFCLITERSANFQQIAKTILTGDVVASIDTSNITGSYYVAFLLNSGHEGKCNISASEVYGE